MSRPDPARRRDPGAVAAAAGASAGKRRGTSEQPGEAADRPAEKRPKPEHAHDPSREHAYDAYERSASLSSSDGDEAEDVAGFEMRADDPGSSRQPRRNPSRPSRITLPAPAYPLDPHQTATRPAHDPRAPPPSPGAYHIEGQPLVNPPQKTQAAFVGKLYNMLEDDKIRESGLLFWAPDGKSFICPRPQQFSKEVLPNYFKHSNWQSFVRQLNMYSFNKVPDVLSTGSGGDPPPWEFRHPLFQRGAPQMLARIKRKSTRHSQPGDFAISPTDEGPRPMAGWMQDMPSTSARPLSGYMTAGSPPRDYPANPGFYEARAFPRPYEPNTTRILHPPPHTASSTGMSFEQYQQPSVAAYPPLQPRINALEDTVGVIRAQNASLAHQVGVLGDNLRHVSEELDRERQRSAAARDTERIERQRMALDTTARIRRSLEYFQLRAGSEEAVNRMRDELRQQEAQLRASLDDLQASDTLVAMRAPPRSLPSAMYDPRLVQTSHAYPPTLPPPPFPARPATTDSPASTYTAPREARERESRYQAYDSPVSETYAGFSASRRPPSFHGPAPSSASSSSTYSGAPFAPGAPVQPTTPRAAQAFGQQQPARPEPPAPVAPEPTEGPPGGRLATPVPPESAAKTSISHLLL
ncbi:Flocculation suppression protein [Cryptotrichosporon argae]